MTTQEFSEQFDSLYNQQYYMLFSVQNPIALDEYEKSLYLTKAQETYVEALYRLGYGANEGFEKTEFARRILQQLVVSCHAILSSDPAMEPYKISKDSYFFYVPDPIGTYGIVYEKAVFGGDDPCAKDKTADVIPVKHDELNRILRSPFRGLSLRRVLRVDNSGMDAYGNIYKMYSNPQTYIDPSGSDAPGCYIELISGYPLKDYFLRYIRRPLPIILVNLPEDAPSIEGYKGIMECELNPAIHRTILEEAVRLALASKSLNTVPTSQQPTEKKEKEDSGE